MIETKCLALSTILGVAGTVGGLYLLVAVSLLSSLYAVILARRSWNVVTGKALDMADEAVQFTAESEGTDG